MTLPLMPKATAVWLIEKTGLTFTQIAEFCGMHPLEVQAIADGEVAAGINGYDPIKNHQLAEAEIKRCEADTNARLKIMPTSSPVKRRAKGARYTRWPSATTVRMPSHSSCASSPAFRSADRQAAWYDQGHHHQGP